MSRAARRVEHRGLIALLLSMSLIGCHELGNPVTRETPETAYPANPPHLTVTVLRYARARDAVAWRRTPAHVLDPALDGAAFVGRLEVQHAPLPRGSTAWLETEFVMQAGGRFTRRWQAPAAANPWLVDVALPGPPLGATTRLVR